MLPALIMVTTLATSSTGGNYAGPGGVVAAGSSYSSSAVVNSVSGGTTSIHVETDVNGRRQVLDRQLEAGQPVTVEVRTSARSGAATSTVRIATSTTRMTGTRSLSTVRLSTSTRASVTAQTRSSMATSSILAASTSAEASPKLSLPAAALTPGWSERIIQAITSFIRSLFSFVP